MIIDEAHMLMKDKSYCGHIDEIKNIEFPIQFVYLTATLPPCYDKEFESISICKPKFIRQKSYKNVQYSVKVVDDVNSGMKHYYVILSIYPGGL